MFGVGKLCHPKFFTTKFFAQVFSLAICAHGRNKPEGHPQAPQDPHLHRPEPPTSLRKRLAVSSFRRRRHLRTTTLDRDCTGLRAPNNTYLSRPDPPTLSRRRLIDPDYRQARQTTLQRLKTADERLKETGKALLPREAAQRHQQGRSTQRSGPAQPSQGRFGAVPPVWPTCGQPAPSQMRVGGRGAGGLGAD